MENIAENNKIIAEFMELAKTVDTNGIVFKDNNTEQLFEIKYHSDWSWLMPVVEKIENIRGTQIFINGISCEIISKGKVFRGIENTKIKAVYNACIEFIKWYNQQK